MCCPVGQPSAAGPTPSTLGTASADPTSGLRLLSLRAAHHSQGELAYPDGEFGAHGGGGSQGRTASRLHSQCPGLVTGLAGHWRPGRLKQKGLSYSCISRGRILGVWGGLPIGAAWAGIPAPVRSIPGRQLQSSQQNPAAPPSPRTRPRTPEDGTQWGEAATLPAPYLLKRPMPSTTSRIRLLSCGSAMRYLAPRSRGTPSTVAESAFFHRGCGLEGLEDDRRTAWVTSRPPRPLRPWLSGPSP